MNEIVKVELVFFCAFYLSSRYCSFEMPPMRGNNYNALPWLHWNVQGNFLLSSSNIEIREEELLCYFL